MKKRIISILLTFLVMVVIVPFGAFDIFASAGDSAIENISGNKTIENIVYDGSATTYTESLYRISGSGNFTVTFNNVTFKNLYNNDVKYGTCLYIDHSSGKVTVNFNNCKFINCGHYNCNGGAIYVYDNAEVELNFTNCLAQDCKGYHGGFIYSWPTKIAINGNNSTVCNNCTAYYSGGAMYLFDNEQSVNGFTFDSCHTTGNSDASDGGAIWTNCDNGKCGILNCNFYNCNAQSEGGAIHSKTSNSHVSNCVFLNNSDNAGYDVDIDNSSTYVENCKFYSATGSEDLTSRVTGVDSSYLSGNGIVDTSSMQLAGENNVYHITNQYDWDCFYYEVSNGNSFAGATIILDCNVATNRNIGAYPDKPFSGTFNGNGKSITLLVNDSTKDAVGVFSYVKDATIKNLTVYGSITGHDDVGGIVGITHSSTINNCINNAEINGNSHVGGIIGSAFVVKKTDLLNCSNFGEIKGSENVGGIVGYSYSDLTLLNCINYSNVHGSNYVGGFIGYEDMGIIVDNCINIGNITATNSNVGAVSGKFTGTEASEHKQCLCVPGCCTNTDKAIVRDASLIPAAINDYISNNKNSTPDWSLAYIDERLNLPVFGPAQHDCRYTTSYNTDTHIYTLNEKCSENDLDNTYTYDIRDYAKKYCIEVKGGAYIDTLYHPTENTRVVMDVDVNEAHEYWFGVWDRDYKTNVFALGNDIVSDVKGVYAAYGMQGGSDTEGSVPKGRHTVELNKNKVYIDGIERTSINYDYSKDGFPINNTLYLFGQNRSGKAHISSNQKIVCYGARIYENGLLVRYFVPSIDNATGKAGLYDLVGGNFYSSNAGTITAYDYTVSFDANGGTVTPTSKTVTFGDTYGDLPTPIGAGYKFDEWYTERTGGTKIESSTKFTLEAPQTLFAHYTSEELKEQVFENAIITIYSNYKGSLLFITSGEYVNEDDVTVAIDGVQLSENDYDLEHGSTHITVFNDVIKPLSVGKHTIRVGIESYETIEQDFYIKNAPSSNEYVMPKTGVK